MNRLLLVLTTLCALSAVGVARAGVPQNGSAESDPPRIQELAAALEQPGPDARAARERAIETLLLMVERRAHEVVCEALVQRGDDPDGVRRCMLEALARKWRQARDPVFGAESSVRPDLHRLYATALVRVFDAEPGIATEEPRLTQQRLVWECFRAMTPLDRKRVFESLLGAGDAALRRAALFAIGGSRDLGLAPLVAAALDDPAPGGAAARLALAHLTFTDRPIRTRAEFDAWFEANRDRAYLDLAEDSARRLGRERERVVRDLESELVTAHVASDNVDWKRIGAILGGAVFPESRQLYLERLRDALAKKPQLGGVAEDRTQLVTALLTQADVAVRPAELGVRLEVLARLVQPADAQRAEVVERLVRGVQNSNPVIRAAALRGICGHYSPDNRRIVVAAGDAALQANEPEILERSLACLASVAWVAPGPDDQDLAAWLSLLDRVLRPSELPLQFKDQAIQVLVQPTAEKARVPQAFDLLMAVVGPERGLQVPVRKNGLGRLRVFTDVDDRTTRCVTFVSGLLGDSEREMREAAARLLGRVLVEPAAEPGRKLREDLTAQIVSDVGARLGLETEEAPLRAAAECLLQVAGGPEDPTNVIGEFTDAVEKYLERDASKRQPFQREVLADGLTRLGGVNGRPLAQWTRAASGLARLEDRKQLRFVLERQRAAMLTGQTGDATMAAWRLIVEAAVLKPADQSWRELSGEAEEVRVAFEELDRLGAKTEDPRERALRVSVLDALDRHEDALTRGAAALADETRPLEPAGKVAVTLAVARARIAKQQLVEAAAVLDGIGDADVPAARALRTDLARRHLARSEFERADELMRAVMAATKDEAPEFAERFVVAMEAKFRREPKANGATVLAELRAKKAVLERATTPEPVRVKWGELIAEITKGEGS